MKKLSKIKMYKSNADLFYSENGKDGFESISLEGDFTREEWAGDFEDYDAKSRNEILDKMEAYEIIKNS